jgi:uncharacterized repeat protein (TIGR03803 family)
VIQRAVAAIAAVLAVAACSRLGSSNVLPSNAIAARALTSFKTIHTFKKGDGVNPSGALIAVNGVLYGVTAGGGSDGNGTVFSVTTGGSEHVVHSFNSEGSSPNGSLLSVNGVLYGATSRGGPKDAGTLFALRTDGTPIWTYDFKGTWGGASPSGGLADLKGELYGTAGGGNYYDPAGMVFKIKASGKSFVVVRDFTGTTDGGGPNGNLVPYRGSLYGTTSYGLLPSNPFGGTAYRMTPSGGESVLYRFKGLSNPDQVEAGLVLFDGTFYGTSYSGGKHGYGTVFSITASGNERLLYSFGSKSGDGEYPKSRLTAYNGNLYGTTTEGGADNFGTVFEISPSGKEQILHSFSGGDGAGPTAGLVQLNGVLYGTTPAVYPQLDGTVYALTP